MPNLCNGSLTIKASDELKRKIFETLHGTDEGNNPFDFSKVIPVPESIRGDFGSEDDWCNENWGTKWNSCDTKVHNDGFTFMTAWSPCSPVIRKLAEMFPDARFEYEYDETGCAFCGHQIYEGGKAQYIMEADYEEYWNDSDGEFEEQFPDYFERREDETITTISIENDVRKGSIKRREDYNNCVHLTDGWFVERLDSNNEEDLESIMDELYKNEKERSLR